MGKSSIHSDASLSLFSCHLHLYTQTPFKPSLLLITCVPFSLVQVCNALILAGIFVAFYFGFLYSSFAEYGIFELGTSAFIALIIGLQMKVGFLHNQWNYLSVIFILISVLGFYIWMLIVNAWLDQFPHYYYSARWTLEQPLTWLFSTITIPIVFGLIDLLGQSYYIFFDIPQVLQFHWASLLVIMIISTFCIDFGARKLS